MATKPFKKHVDWPAPEIPCDEAKYSSNILCEAKFLSTPGLGQVDTKCKRWRKSMLVKDKIKIAAQAKTLDSAKDQLLADEKCADEETKRELIEDICNTSKRRLSDSERQPGAPPAVLDDEQLFQELSDFEEEETNC